MNVIDVIAERFLDLYRSDYADSEKAEKLAESMQSDGSWSDLDYEAEKLPLWKSIVHFDRLNYLAFSGKYDEKVIKGLGFWYKKERKDTNWWWNDIGIQLDLAVCATIFKDKLKGELKKKVTETFNEYVGKHWTGTNRFWLAQNVIVRGIILGDSDLIMRGKKYLEDTIYISKTGEEGIQPDFAFAQHGPQLYNNGYGRALVMDAGTWIKIFKGTDFAFSKEKIDIITSLILDGCGHMCFCEVPDFNTIGRDLVRGYNGRDTRMLGYLTAIETLKDISTRNAELETLEAFIKGDSRAFNRTRMFNSLNIMTGVHNGGYASVRFGSAKVLGADVIDGKIINDEDRFSGWRGCFCAQYMVTGREYDRIFPVWSWAHLPGVSCPETELRSERGAVMKSAFAGGTSDGENGVCAIDLNEDFSKDDEKVIFGGKKACFFIGNEIIHLGCGLYSETDLNTTVNQCIFDKSFNIDGESYGFAQVEKSAKYILHSNIAYIFAEPTEICVSARHIDGEWNKITAMTETVKISKDVFMAYIPHKKSDSYAYAVLMNEGGDRAKSYAFPEFVNTEKVQAVKRGDIVCAVFYEAGKLNMGSISLTVESPCFVIAKDGKITSKHDMQ